MNMNPYTLLDVLWYNIYLLSDKTPLNIDGLMEEFSHMNVKLPEPVPDHFISSSLQLSESLTKIYEDKQRWVQAAPYSPCGAGSE